MNITSFFSHTIKKEEKQMKKSKKDYPVTPAYEDIMFNEAGSSNECTGLIPSAVSVSYTHLTLPTTPYV